MVKWESVVALFSVALVSLYALASRALAFFQPYHQDEYKWALWADPFWNVTEAFPHPGLALNAYEHIGAFIGYSHLRLVPILLSLGIMALLFIYVRRLFGMLAAICSIAIYAACFYALLGSAQVDIDGTFLPFAALISFLGYAIWRDADSAKAARWGLAIGIVGLGIGFVAKLSFVLVPITIILDMLWRKPELVRRITEKRVIALCIIAAGIAGVALALVWNDVPFFRYVDNFVAFGGRDYFQLLFLTAKGFIYLSPLALGILLGLRYARELSLWFIFLGLNILFYFVVFDFSHRTLDRYLLFFVLPTAVIAGVAFARLFSEIPRQHIGRFVLLTAGSFAASAGIAHFIFSLPHRVIPLIPKSAFVDAVVQGDWAILLPFTGGSGPLGFYLPLDGVALLWGLTISAAMFLLAWRPVPYVALALFIGVSLSYNVFVTAEYLFGRSFGSAPAVVHALMVDIDTLRIAEPILTYNDVGAYELHERGLYAARFYPHAEFIENNAEKFKNHAGLFLVVQMPQLNPLSGYARYFEKCAELATSTSGQMSGVLLDCSGVPTETIRE